MCRLKTLVFAYMGERSVFSSLNPYLDSVAKTQWKSCGSFFETGVNWRDEDVSKQARKLQATLEVCNPKLSLTDSLTHRGKV